MIKCTENDFITYVRSEKILNADACGVQIVKMLLDRRMKQISLESH